MELVLTVTQAPQGTQSQDQQYVLTTAGGTIGRAETSACHLPCPDRVVSSQHASVQYQGGQFYLVDTSKNGTEVNGTAAPKHGDAPLALNNGDIIQCGRFQLSVVLRSSDMAALPKGLGTADFLDNAPAVSAAPNFPAPNPPAAGGGFATPDDVFADNLGLSSSAQEDSLDAWLGEPSSSFGQPANNTPAVASPPLSAGSSSGGLAGWGTVADKNKGDVCPIEALDSNPADDFERDIFGNPVNGVEPQADLSAPSPSAWEDEEWWKGESASSQAPASSAHVYINPMSESAPASPAPSTPRPGGAPTPPAPAVSPDAFAASHNNIDASNIDDILGFDAPPAHAAPAPNSAPAAAWATPQAVPPQPEQSPAAQPAPATAHQQPVQNQPSAASSSEDFGRYLGVNAKTQLPEQQLKALGAKIIRDTVNRLMGLIKARVNIKNELRVQHTTLQAQDNNPLKFSVNAEDALNAMFSENRSTSFMAPDQAISDSFDDLSDHQIAVMAGMQAAYDHMFKQFSPSKLESLFNAKAGLLGNKRAANWEAFKAHYQRLTSDREASYNQLFGQTFAKQYEQRLAELKSRRISRKAHDAAD
ncbi:MAG TPA: type VI secretion system-associated FHA domain protein TagH [Marinagarivorans sp.]